MNARSPLAAFAQAACKLIDDDNLAVANHVLPIQNHFAADFDRPLDMLVNRRKRHPVHRGWLGQLPYPAAARQIQLDRFLFMVVLEVLLFDKLADILRCPAIRLGFKLFFLAWKSADDQRSARFIDENAVGLVDQHEMQFSLHGLLVISAGLPEHRAEQVALPFADPPLEQAVAEEVEAHFVGRAVGDIACILLGPLGLLHLLLNAADLHAERFVERAHPVGVAFGEVVVDCGEVGPIPFQRGQVEWQCRGECFSFARLHLDDRVMMHRCTAQELHVEVPHVHSSSPGLADESKCFD